MERFLGWYPRSFAGQRAHTGHQGVEGHSVFNWFFFAHRSGHGNTGLWEYHPVSVQGKDSHLLSDDWFWKPAVCLLGNGFETTRGNRGGIDPAVRKGAVDQS